MKNTKKGFKLTSPLKLKDGPGDEKKASESNVSSKSYPAQSGGYKVTATETKVKKSATGANVGVGGNEAALKKGAKNLGANYRPSKAATAAANKKLKEAREKDKAAASSKATSASEETTTTVSPELTEAKAGTTSDTFTSEEKRVQNRGELVTNRFERKTGRQNLNRDLRSIKNSAEWKGMTSAEKKAAEFELKHGQTNKEKESGKSALDRFGEDTKKNVEQARKMKYGQGEQSKSYLKQEMERPGEATTTRNAQYLQGKNTEFSSNTKNYEDVQKAVEGNKKIKADASEKLPEVTPGSKSISSSESSITQSPTTDPNAVGKMKASALKFVMKGFGSKAGFNFNKKK